MSRYHFHRLFKKITGLTPHAYAMALRHQRLQQQLPKHTASRMPFMMPAISPAAVLCRIHATAGHDRHEHRAGGSQQCHSLCHCPVQPGCHSGGPKPAWYLCHFAGGRSGTIAQQLQDQFPKADLQGDEQAFEQQMAAVIA
jgi:AraC family transcriptional regulator of adaptative response/methylated-DNA-[protein]-cysteine methyltransferase